LGISPLIPPADKAPLIILIWMLIGVVALIYFKARGPERISQTGTIFLEA
jgi:hypothetical protein